MYHRRIIDINSIQQQQLLPKYLSSTTHLWPPILPEPWPGQFICLLPCAIKHPGPGTCGRASRTSRSGLDMRFSIAWQIWGLERATWPKDDPRMVLCMEPAFAPLDTFCLFGSMSTRTMRLASSMPGLSWNASTDCCIVVK